MSRVGSRLGAVLADRRKALNIRFRREGRAVDHDAFYGYLERTVNPIVEQVEGDVAALVEALFDLGLAGVRRGLIGQSEASPFETSLQTYLPRLPLGDPRRMVTSVGNAYDRLRNALSEAAAIHWLTTLADVTEVVPDVLEAGLILAWTHGLAEARSAALSHLAELEPAVRHRLVGVEQIDPDPGRRFAPLGAESALGAPKVITHLGGFLGFGGPFSAPPEVRSLDGRLYATDGEVVREIFADVFGARLCRAPSATVLELLDHGQINDGVRVTRYGTVKWGKQSAKLEALEGASTIAAIDGLAAVTLKRSHFVFIVGRTPE